MEQGTALRVPARDSQQWRLQRQCLVVVKAPVPHTQRWPPARALDYGDGIGDASRLRYQSRQELVCCTKLWRPEPLQHGWSSCWLLDCWCAALIQDWEISGWYNGRLRSGAGWYLLAGLSSYSASPCGWAEGGRGARRGVCQLSPSHPGWHACNPRVGEAGWRGVWWVDLHTAGAGGENLTRQGLAANWQGLAANLQGLAANWQELAANWQGLTANSQGLAANCQGLATRVSSELTRISSKLTRVSSELFKLLYIIGKSVNI